VYFHSTGALNDRKKRLREGGHEILEFRLSRFIILRLDPSVDLEENFVMGWGVTLTCIRGDTRDAREKRLLPSRK